MNPPISLAFVPIARTTFDMALATEVTGQARALLGSVFSPLAGPDDLITTVEQAEAAFQQLAAEPPDALLIFQATFADSTMVMRLARAADTPLILWSVPEARTGGRLRLNSLCGINLAAHALTRAGLRYDTIYAAPDDPAALKKVQAITRAGYARRRLRGARIGRIGEHPAGFETCGLNRDALRQRFGVEIVQYDLQTSLEMVRIADPHEITNLVQELSTRVDQLDQVDQQALRDTLGTYATLRRLAEQEQISSFAVRCWPEFFTQLGCAACGASSLLNEGLTPASCEADVNGAITQLILQWISGEPAFDSDLVNFDLEDDTAVLWHCGKAPLSMSDPAIKPRATIHSNRHLPLLMEFPLKPGTVTLARLSEATGDYRLVVGRGEMQRAPISFSGTSGVVRFERPARDVLDTLLSEGLEHHLALTYGDHVEALLALAKLLNLPVLRL